MGGGSGGRRSEWEEDGWGESGMVGMESEAVFDGTLFHFI